MPATRAVHAKKPHIFYRGDADMERKYAATYHFGKTVVHVVEPPPLTEEEKEKVLYDLLIAEWEAWNSLPVEERLRINAEYDTRKAE